jgi:hypothetical protein
MGMKADTMGYGHDRFSYTLSLCNFHSLPKIYMIITIPHKSGDGKQETGDRGKVAVPRLLSSVFWYVEHYPTSNRRSRI